MKTGIFDRQFADQLQVDYNGGKYNFQEARDLVLEMIQDSTATRANKLRISSAVARTTNFIALLTVIYNHILAHPSEGLKVI